MNEDKPGHESIFNEISETYHNARPSYPGQLLEDLINTAGLTPDSSVLEIGAGTGKLTEALARRGLAITGIELGNNMAAIARRGLYAFPNAEIIVGDFNSFDFPPGSFNAVIAATSFHWLDKNTRSGRMTDLLKNNGVAAVVETRHVDAGIDGFPVASQQCYRKWNSLIPEDYKLPTPEEVLSGGFRHRNEFDAEFRQVLDKSGFWRTNYKELHLATFRGQKKMISLKNQDRDSLLPMKSWISFAASMDVLPLSYTGVISTMSKPTILLAK